MAEDVLQTVEKVTKEKDAIHKEKIETLASLENSRQTNEKLQNEVTIFKCFYLKSIAWFVSDLDLSWSVYAVKYVF